MRALYISHNGMLEGLGQSQVLPYVRGLAQRGVEIELLSFELPSADRAAMNALADSLATSGIRWSPLRRRRDTRLVVKVGEILKGAGVALARALSKRPDVVHGRSYLPTLVCDMIATVVPKARLVFDCRGMLGDEYVDAGHWTTSSFEYRAVKQFEDRAFQRADAVVVLTHALERWLQQRRSLGPSTQLRVIPCCVDLDKFAFQEAARDRVRAQLELVGKLVVIYAGSLGSWYREKDIARFAGIVRRRAGREVAFMLLTHSPSEELAGLLAQEGFRGADVIVRRVAPSDMPAHLSAGDIGVSFIKSCFSKKGSSPTKVAEYLACGMPTVLNGDIGDQAALAVEKDACIVPPSFSDEDLTNAADRALALASAPLARRTAECRRVADEYFGLERVGVERYARLYQSLVEGRRD